MSTFLVTFSDDSMSQSAELCMSSAYRHGIDNHARMNPSNILLCEAFRPYWSTLIELFKHPRGRGYWAWKPLIIGWAMGLLKDGDTVVYSDAGVEFINNVNHIIDRMDQDIFLFGNMWQHLHWCKADALAAIVPEIPSERFNKQAQASVIFFRVSDWSRRFVKEWLEWCLTPGLIDDSPSVLPNHAEFREHRHDQALLTCMAYKYGIPLHWWPAVYNRFQGPGFTYEKGEYVDSYPPLFHHHRLRDSEWDAIPQLTTA